MFSKAGRNFTSSSITELWHKKNFTAEDSVLIRANYNWAEIPSNEKVSPTFTQSLWDVNFISISFFIYGCGCSDHSFRFYNLQKRLLKSPFVTCSAMVCIHDWILNMKYYGEEAGRKYWWVKRKSYFWSKTNFRETEIFISTVFSIAVIMSKKEIR